MIKIKLPEISGGIKKKSKREELRDKIFEREGFVCGRCHCFEHGRARNPWWI